MDQVSSLLTNWRRVHSNGLLQSPWEKQKKQQWIYREIDQWPSGLRLGWVSAVPPSLLWQKLKKNYIWTETKMPSCCCITGVCWSSDFSGSAEETGDDAAPFPLSPSPYSWSWSGQKIQFKTSQWWFWRLEATLAYRDITNHKPSWI